MANPSSAGVPHTTSTINDQITPNGASAPPCITALASQKAEGATIQMMIKCQLKRHGTNSPIAYPQIPQNKRNMIHVIGEVKNTSVSVRYCACPAYGIVWVSSVQVATGMAGSCDPQLEATKRMSAARDCKGLCGISNVDKHMISAARREHPNAEL